MRRLVMTIGAASVLVLAATAQGGVPRACGLLDLAGLEARFGGKAGAPRGLDNKDMSTCTVAFGSHEVRIETAVSGTPGVPSTIAQGIAAASKLGNGSAFRSSDSAEFGRVGCYRAINSRDATGKPMTKPVYRTTCFSVDGGYTALTAASDEPAQVTFEAVRELLARALSSTKKE